MTRRTKQEMDRLKFINAEVLKAINELPPHVIVHDYSGLYVSGYVDGFRKGLERNEKS